MPALIRVGGVAAVRAFASIVGVDAVVDALEATRGTRPKPTSQKPCVVTAQRERELRDIDRLMRQRAAGPLGSAV